MCYQRLMADQRLRAVLITDWLPELVADWLREVEPNHNEWGAKKGSPLLRHSKKLLMQKSTYVEHF